MIALTDVRTALEAALAGLGYNVSAGDKVDAPAARVALFSMDYHRTFAEVGTHVARTTVQVIVSRADEDSATSAVDDALTTVWSDLEHATGPWLALLVTQAAPEVVSIAEATYAAATLTLEVFV